MNKTILIIEDDAGINDMLNILLQQNGYRTISAFSGTEGILVHNEDVNLILLDLMLPGRSGEDIIRELKSKYNVPIIIISAIHDVHKKVDLFALGADDYVTKPFQPLELIARVKAQLRRCQKYDNSKRRENIIDFRGILINDDTHEFFFNEKKVNLTKIEFSILWLLCENRGNVIKNDELFEKVWGEKYFEKDNNTIMVHIRHLREKMNDTGKNPKYIKTVYGVGYKIEK